MTDKLDSQIDRFFVEQMLPLSVKAKATGTRFLQTEIERDAPTYYLERVRRTMSKADFETGGCVSPDTIEADLQALWQDEKTTGLSTLCAGMAALAKDLRTVGKDDSDVSNFIYVMF